MGLIGLDEKEESYALKLMSAMYGVAHEKIELEWDTPGIKKIRTAFENDAQYFAESHGYRPTPEDMEAFLDEAAAVTGRKPEVIFLDYISLLSRDKFAGAEVQRVQRLIEELQVWTNKTEVVTVALHQVGRFDDGGNKRNEGDTPLSSGSLKYGGEEIADVVLGTYRPSLDPVGNMPYDAAKSDNDRLTEEEWEERRSRVHRYQDSTFLQLLKNRPGVHLSKEGIELISIGDTMKMRSLSERT